MKNAKVLIVGTDLNLTQQIQTCLLAGKFTSQNISCYSGEKSADHNMQLHPEFILAAMPESRAEKDQVQTQLTHQFPHSSIIWIIKESQLKSFSLAALESEHYVIAGSLLEYDLNRTIRYACRTDKRRIQTDKNDGKEVRAEHHLEKKINQLETVINSVTNGFFTINANWEITKVNRECERITRHTRSQLMGRRLWDLFPHVKELKCYNEYLRAMEDQVSVHFEEYDPEYETWVSVNIHPVEEGLAVYLTDITAQKKMQEDIFVSEQNLLAIINNTDDIIWSINKKGEIITANQSFRKRLSAITGKPYSSDLTMSLDAAVLETWKQFFERAFSGESYKVTMDQVRDGEQFFEEINFNPIRSKSGEVIGISCFSRDITDIQLHLQKIEEQNLRLKQIAWTQSHEVRKPLANILGLIELLQFHPSTQDRRQLISHIETAAVELDTIVNKISAFTCGKTG
jgi:PAS domain S-box-containing protein